MMWLVSLCGNHQQTLLNIPTETQQMEDKICKVIIDILFMLYITGETIIFFSFHNVLQTKKKSSLYIFAVLM